MTDVTPAYREFLTTTGLPGQWINTFNGAEHTLQELTGSTIKWAAHQPNIDAVIDRRIEQVIAAAGGDPKIALFGAIAAYGQAIRFAFGTKPGG